MKKCPRFLVKSALPTSTVFRWYKEFSVFMMMKDSHLTDKDPIPSHLLECYEKPLILLPMSGRTLIEIIRKIELNPYFLMDVSMLSNAIIHRFWRDGLVLDRNIGIPDENVVPYKPTGFQSYKYRLLSSKLIPGSALTFPNDTLTLTERCSLHFMLSSSVEMWERGDEPYVCPASFGEYHLKIAGSEGWTARKSACPIERGVVKTDFGTVSPSHLLTSIATGLEPMQVLQSLLFDSDEAYIGHEQERYVENIWAASITGDLAEMVVLQSPTYPQLHYGPGGHWNDSTIPVNYYLTTTNQVLEKELWHFTDAEILGALDGMIISEEGVKYSRLMDYVRLSQLLEMYYSPKGGNYPSQLHVCKRKTFFGKLVKHQEIIIEQTINFAQVLSLDAPHYFVNNSYILNNTRKAVNEFRKYTSKLLGMVPLRCPEGIYTRPKINLFAIYDTAWSSYDLLTFLMKLSEDIDVSYYGSSITIINGGTGEVIVNSVKNVSGAYLQWKNATEFKKNVFSFSLSKSLLTLVNILPTNDDFSQISPVSWVTLVLGTSSTLSGREIELSLSSLQTIRSINPDMQYVYITSDILSSKYVKFTSIPGSQSDKIITTDGQNQHRLMQDLQELQYVPRAIKPKACGNSSRHIVNFDLEEYASPSTAEIYSIHPKYLCGSSRKVIIKFKNRNYGNVVGCLSRELISEDESGDKERCVEAALDETVELAVFDPCPYQAVYGDHQSWNPLCKPLYLRTHAKKSLSRCTEGMCRTPDQVRFNIIIEGLQCVKNLNTACSSGSGLLKNLGLISVITIFWLHQLTNSILEAR